MGRVLITGGTGTLGTALCGQFLAAPPDRLVCFSRDWLKQKLLREMLGDPPFMRWFLGDVADSNRLWRALDGIDTVIHAAALKDIVAGNYNPSELLKTNVIGTENVINTAIDRGVEKVLVISSDKGVSATNAYGISKAMAEVLAVASNAYARSSGTKISVARYGNVWASSGSVIPTFRKQAATGVLTVTDLRMTRFWLTIEEAVKFILMCLDTMQGGEIFVPKLKSARVVDIANAVAPGCLIEEVGIKCGEKLHECLISECEARHTKDCGDHYVVEPVYDFWEHEHGSLGEGFEYRSDTNTEWLSAKEIEAMIGEKP